MSEKKNQTDGISGAKRFWRLQGACAYRALTPYLMYLVMGILMLACQFISNAAAKYVLSIICIIGGMLYNVYLTYHEGVKGYEAYVTGRRHRENVLFGIEEVADHHSEREYRVWKGFLIGFYVGLPVILVGIIAGSVPSLGTGGELILDMFAGWAVIPFQWIRDSLASGWVLYFAAFMSIIPIVVSGVSYIVGAMIQKRKRDDMETRAERVRELSGKNKKK